MLIVTSVQYISETRFVYFETYSFNRGPLEVQRQALLALAANEQDPATLLKLSQQGRALDEQMKRKFASRSPNILSDLNLNFNLNVNLNLNLNPTAVRTGIFDANSRQSLQLINILMTEVKNVKTLKCKPEYRDAIIFYNEKKQVVSHLEVCLECEHMLIDGTRLIDADDSTYDKCRDFFFNTLHHHPALGLL